MVEGYILPRVASPSQPLRLGVLISGSGSGLEALLRHQENNEVNHETVLVISDQPGVMGLDRASRFGVMGICVPLPPRSDFSEGKEGALARRFAHEEEISNKLNEYDVELVVCSGYMRILTDNFLSPRLGRVINIHPSPWGDKG
ncbi:MAG: hypothetical protein CMO20_03190, partial [Thermoplasmata archaeon]|nr:hypothetical protein [Thermoplasmata archaeon]